MRKAVLATIAVAALAALPAAEGAAGGNIDTDVEVEEAIETGGQLIIVGNILAPNKCQKFRAMELVADGQVVDEGSSSRRGTWALAFEDKSELEGPKRVRALRSQAGGATCSADAESFAVR